MRLSEEIPEPLAGERLDRVVSMVAGCSRTTAADWITRGVVLLNDEVASTRSLHLVAGDRVDIDVPEPPDETVYGDGAIKVDVVYSDDDVIVVDKPAGLVVHPGAGHHGDTLVNGLLARFPELAPIGQQGRPGIVHRLDRGTSGLLVVARSAAAYDSLVEALASHRVDRHYTALVRGHPESDRGLIDAPIGRSSRIATQMAVSARGRAARTHYEVTARYTTPVSVARLACRLETGRTHQIRVHLSAIGHPLVADATYGGSATPFDLGRPFLHAGRLGFTHPVTGDALEFSSPLPDELQRIIDFLESEADQN